MKELIVNSQDVELYVQVHGNADKPALLFLHGFPDNHKTWHKQVEHFSKQYQVICFDMRGVGRSTESSKKNAYKMRNLLQDIEAVINAVVSKQGQVHLIGHDWGSVIGWSFITEPYYADRVLSYTSMSGPHLGLMLHWARQALLSGNVQQWKDLAKQLGSSWYVYFLNIPRVPEFLLRRFGLSAWQFALRKNGVEADDDYLEVNQRELEGFTLNPIGLYRQNPLDPPEIPQPNGIQVPVQLIIPTEDAFISDKLYKGYEKYVPRLSQRVIHAKHWAHHSHAATFNRWVEQFIESIEKEKTKRAA